MIKISGIVIDVLYGSIVVDIHLRRDAVLYSKLWGGSKSTGNRMGSPRWRMVLFKWLFVFVMMSKVFNAGNLEFLGSLIPASSRNSEVLIDLSITKYSFFNPEVDIALMHTSGDSSTLKDTEALLLVV